MVLEHQIFWEIRDTWQNEPQWPRIIEKHRFSLIFIEIPRIHIQKVAKTAGLLLKSKSSAFLLILEVAKRAILLFKNSSWLFLDTR